MLRDTSYEERAQAIYDMRTHIRDKYQDIRNRNDIIRDLWDFVMRLEENLEDAAPAKPKKGKKARRVKDEDAVEDEKDYRPAKKHKGK